MTRVAQDQRLDPNHCRNGQHLVKQLGIGDRRHDGGLAEPVRVHVGSVLTSGLDAPRPAKSVDDAPSGLQLVDNAVREAAKGSADRISTSDCAFARLWWETYAQPALRPDRFRASGRKRTPREGRRRPERSSTAI